MKHEDALVSQAQHIHYTSGGSGGREAGGGRKNRRGDPGKIIIRKQDEKAVYTTAKLGI